MKNRQENLDKLNEILPDYLLENTSAKQEINQHNFVEITEKILQLISLQPYHDEAKIVLNDLCERLYEIEKIIPYNYCLFTGRIRIIYTFLKVYESLRNDKYLTFAKSFFVKEKVIDYVMTSQNCNGLLKGRSGTFMGLLYLKKHAPELKLKDIIDLTFREIIRNLVLDKFGLSNFYPESHINSITNLSGGNAGLIWFFTTLTQQKSKNETGKIIESLLDSLNGQWNNRWSNWKDNSMKITTVDDHFAYIKQFEKGDMSFFKSPKNNYEYWEGTLGICTSLVNYLMLFSSRNSEILDKVERSLKGIEKKGNDAYKLQNVKVLYYLYVSLYSITNNTEYELKAHKLLKISALKASIKVSLLLCVLNNNDAKKLDILPTFENLKYLPKDLLEDIQKSLIIRYYPITVNLLSHSEKKYFELNFLKNMNELNAKFFQNFEINFKNCSFIKTNQHRKIVRDSFKLEQFNRRNAQKHQNKVFLKIQEIAQFSQANEVLNLSESDLLEKEFIVADNVYLVETKWNWLQIDKMPLDEIIKTPPHNYYGLIKIKPNKEQKTALALSENQLILMEIFYDRVSIKNAKALFLSNFDIKSASEHQNLLSFMYDTIEQFIFNKYVVLVK